MPIGKESIRTQHEKLFVVYYNQTITGSQELRNYNRDVVANCYPDTPTDNTPLDYYRKYDLSPGGKKNEPFYDAFLVHMATLDANRHPEYGLEDIDYYEEQYTRVKENTGKESQFTKTFAALSSKNPKKRVDLKYNEAKHIFLLCPTAAYMVRDIEKMIIAHLKTPIIIHIQGDIKKMSPDDTTTQVKKAINDRCTMEPPGGMFDDAFNLYSGGEDHKELRETLNNLGAHFLSASPKFESDTSGVPLYYRKANNDILLLSAANNSELASVYDKLAKSSASTRVVDLANKFGSLASGRALERQGARAQAAAGNNLNIRNILKVYQDGTDKDNLAGLILLGKAAKKARMMPKMFSSKIDLDFIGLRIYTSNSKPFGSDGPVNGSTFKLPFTIGDHMTTLDNQKEFFQPGDCRPSCVTSPASVDESVSYGNNTFSQPYTIEFYKAQLDGFERCLNMCIPNTFQFNLPDNKYIVDGVRAASKSLRAPFNMSLFFWAPKTYMSKAIITATKSSTDNEDIDYIKAMKKIKGDTAGMKEINVVLHKDDEDDEDVEDDEDMPADYDAKYDTMSGITNAANNLTFNPYERSRQEAKSAKLAAKRAAAQARAWEAEEKAQREAEERTQREAEERAQLEAYKREAVERKAADERKAAAALIEGSFGLGGKRKRRTRKNKKYNKKSKKHHKKKSKKNKKKTNHKRRTHKRR